MKHNSEAPIQPPNGFIEHNFQIQRQRLSCSSAYLEPALAAFLMKQLMKHKTTSSKYISHLLLRFRTRLPKRLPANVGPKRLHQDRIERRVRICFTPDVEDYWDLKMMSLSADVSIGMVVAVLVEMDMEASQIQIIHSFAAITNLKDRISELFTIKLNLSTNHVQRSFQFRAYSLISTSD